MILTCDIHHQALDTGNQKFSEKSELDCAYDFFKMCESNELRVTMFFSGLALKNDWNEKLEEICSSPLVEIGGHNWNCFTPALFHRVCKKVINSYNGPMWYQVRDCEKTMEMIHKKTGQTITSWRNHMYMHGPNTLNALSRCGIKVCSDGVKKSSFGFDYSDGVLELPINVIPDHEHIYHAERSETWVRQWIERYKWKDDFGSESYYIDDWADIFLANIRENISNGKESTIIIHPITMYLSDSYRFIFKFLKNASNYHTQTIEDARYSYEKEIISCC